jgi:hypothetical protein
MAASVEMSGDLSTIDISLLARPYQDFMCLFTCFMGRDSTYHIPRSMLYVLYFAFQIEAMFDWVEVSQTKFPTSWQIT